jgi:cytoskeletal protein CcmA (bactofilin family)
MGESRNDLRIAGAGNVSGGLYGAVVVSGTGTVKGDLDCTELRVGGTADVEGNLKAGTATIGGAATIKGNVEAGLLKVGGSASIHGDANVKTLAAGGSTDVQGNLTGEKIDVKGGVRVGGDCSAEEFAVKCADCSPYVSTAKVYAYYVFLVLQNSPLRIRIKFNETFLVYEWEGLMSMLLLLTEHQSRYYQHKQSEYQSKH